MQVVFLALHGSVNKVRNCASSSSEEMDVVEKFNFEKMVLRIELWKI